MFITHEPGVTGRGRNTGWWAGIANLFWWCDREKGVAGMIASQIMPFGDPQVMGQWFACEGAVYAGIRHRRKVCWVMPHSSPMSRVKQTQFWSSGWVRLRNPPLRAFSM